MERVEIHTAVKHGLCSACGDALDAQKIVPMPKGGKHPVGDGGVSDRHNVFSDAAFDVQIVADVDALDCDAIEIKAAAGVNIQIVANVHRNHAGEIDPGLAATQLDVQVAEHEPVVHYHVFVPASGLDI